MKINVIYALILASTTTLSWFSPIISQTQPADAACIFNIGCRYHHHYRHHRGYYRENQGYYRHNQGYRNQQYR